MRRAAREPAGSCRTLEELRAGRGRSAAPGCARLRGKGAFDAPASCCVRVAELGRFVVWLGIWTERLPYQV